MQRKQMKEFMGVSDHFHIFRGKGALGCLQEVEAVVDLLKLISSAFTSSITGVSLPYSATVFLKFKICTYRASVPSYSISNQDQAVLSFIPYTSAC
jgi:hypothetical protein